MTQHNGFFGKSVWESNAPKRFSDIAISDDNTRLDLEDYVRFPQLAGNIILEGGVGSGKTTIAQVIASERVTNAVSVIELNGAIWNDDTLRSLNNTYSWGRSSGEVPIVIINEVDRLKGKQYDLRMFLDDNKDKGLVIMTTNHLGNIDGSIIDRSEVFHIKGFTPQQAVLIGQPLLNKCGVTIANSALEALFQSKLIGDETDLSLRKIGRVLDRVVMLNTQTPSQPPQKGSHLKSV
jgi:replication-associated recombination protein RarA